MDTVWVFADQLNIRLAHLAGRAPGSCRVLLIESTSKLSNRRWHPQRAHLMVSALRHFAADLVADGHLVDHRRAPTFASGLAAHRDEHRPDRVVAMEPNSRTAHRLLGSLGVETVRSDQFLCHYEDFAAWAEPRDPRNRSGRLRMEDFYRWNRSRLGYLMDGDEPIGGQWNLDSQNREPPPRDGRAWPLVPALEPDPIDREVAAEVAAAHRDGPWGGEPPVGAPPDGQWPTTRAQAQQRLEAFVGEALPGFGPHQDAMLAAEWKLAHSALSSSLNIGLLSPGEVCDAVEAAYHDGTVPLASAEGFIRQVVGWREYVWGLYWLWGEDYAQCNHLDATRPLPPAFTDATTAMACVASALDHVHQRAYAHHIERLMVLGNLCLLAGVVPGDVVDWMWERFVDGAEWVMVPNVVGMALWADGGRMATKPYAGGGAYLNRMGDHCAECRFDPKRRVGDDACPFTTLYWDFLARNEASLRDNHRMSRPLGAMRKLSDLPAVRERATIVLAGLDAGTL